MQLTLVPESAVRQIINTELAFAAVKDALEAVARGASDIRPVVLADAAPERAMFGVKTATVLDAGLLGLKVGSYFPNNERAGIPNHGSTTLLLDPETGLPKALVSAGYLNGLRTAAANAVAVEQLARKDAKVLGVLGAGHQAGFEIRAVAARRKLDCVKLWSRTPERSAALREELSDLEVEVIPVDTARAAVEGSDLITTVTPSTEPLLEASWVQEGTHISAMGADTPGKQELDPELMRRARAFVDLPKQSARVGEFQHALRLGILELDQLTPIGAVCVGAREGRTREDEVTVFDSSGVAPQDLHVASAVLVEAVKRELATVVDF